MPQLSMIPTLLREIALTQRFPREPEPDLVMDGPEQVAAFAEAGRIDGVMAATYLFNSARISQVIQGCKTVLDLGCGPATQLAQVAQFNPSISFIGVDLSPAMLSSAEAHVKALGLTNVKFIEGDISKLDKIADKSVDGVMSTLALHHLPTQDHLSQCFRQVNRVLQPGGALYLIDLGRLKSLKSVLFFAYLNTRFQPHIFSLDYERSLRAAFLRDDFESLAKQALPPGIEVFNTFKLPVLLLIKTVDRPLSQPLRDQFQEMRRKLGRRYRSNLDDIRLFMWLGGLRNDPFR